jgi:[protein-PII] uridylyltransferase
MPDLPMAELAPRERSGANRHRPAPHDRDRHRDRLFARLRAHPPSGISGSEVDRHFHTMPARYWERVTKSDLMWGLETVHEFLAKASAAGAPGACVTADWRHCPERGFTKVMLCAWDRAGLLAKIAAAFSALRINILRADVYTRDDGVALDHFEVSDSAATVRLEHLPFLVEGALSEPPRFVSFWAAQFHKTVPASRQGSPHVEFDNQYSPEHTVVRVETPDRMGLLHDLLQTLTDCGMNIAQAVVGTDHNLACDEFYITDIKNRKVEDTQRLDTLSNALVAAVNG